MCGMSSDINDPRSRTLTGSTDDRPNRAFMSKSESSSHRKRERERDTHTRRVAHETRGGISNLCRTAPTGFRKTDRKRKSMDLRSQSRQSGASPSKVYLKKKTRGAAYKLPVVQMDARKVS